MPRLRQNAMWNALGQGLSVLAQAAYFVIVTRLLGVREFGLYATVVALVAVVSQYANLGSGYVLLRYGSMDEHEVPVYWGNVLLAVASCGLLVVAALCGFAHFWTRAVPLMLVGTVAISDCFFLAIVNAAAQAFQSRERLKVSATLTLSTNLARLLMAIVLLAWLHRADSLVWARAVLATSICVAGCSFAAVTRAFGWPIFEPKLLARRAAEGLSFSLSLSTTALYNDLDKVMLGHFGFTAAVGTYTAAYRVLNAANMPAYAVFGAAFPRFFRAGAKGAGDTVALAKRLALRTGPFLLLLPPALFAVAPYAARLFGPGFSDTALALRWLCLLPVLRAIQWSAGDAISGLGRQHLRLALQAAAVLFNLGLNLWLIPRYSWHGAAWATLLTDGALGVAMWIALLTLRTLDVRRHAATADRLMPVDAS